MVAAGSVTRKEGKRDFFTTNNNVLLIDISNEDMR